MNKHFSTTLICILALTLGFFSSCRHDAKTSTSEMPKLTEAEVLASLQASRNREVQRIDSLEQLIRKEIKEQKDPDVALAMHAIQGYQYFAADYPTDSLAPEYLFKSAQLYEGVLRNQKKALEAYEKVYERYPDYKKRAMALFLSGNLHHELNDTTKAIAAFTTFRKDYPNHTFANDAAGMINYIRMGADEQKRTFGGKKGRQATRAKKQPA